MGEPETVIFVVGVAGSPLKLEDELFILQFMECLSTGFSWQVALGNQLHFYFYQTLFSWAVICWSWIFTWEESTVVSYLK